MKDIVFEEYEKNWAKLKGEDEASKEKGILVGRFIQEPRADGYAIYKIIKENRKTVRIKVVRGIGDDWTIPYWGEETSVDKKFAIENIFRRDKIKELFKHEKQ